MTQEAADLNLVTHMTWVQSRLPGGHVEVGSDLVLSDSGLPSDTFNFVTRARLNSGVEPAIRRVTGYFIAAARPFSWWIGPADRPADLGRALSDWGFHAADSEVAMAVDLSRLGPGDVAPAGLHIERVTTTAQIREFAGVVAANWSPPDEVVRRFYESAAPLLTQGGCPIRLYVGYLDGAPVATAELTVSEGAVGLYNIATLEAYRRRGFGTALTLRPLLDARREGHALAVLQASQQGVGVYARLGFRETGRYTEYQPRRR